MKLPSKQTLRKYGLTEQEWLAQYNKYGGRCHCCLKLPKNATRNLHVDHEHIKNWDKLLPEERKKFVRGLCCYRCNRFRLLNDTDRRVAKNMLRYLERYESSK